MAGLSPKLPLRRDTIDGYQLTKTFREMIAQNLRHLILTAPGERMMIPDFGVGIKRYLFESNNDTTYDDISGVIYGQVEKYMPHIEIQQILFDGEGDLDENTLSLVIEYEILPLGVQDMIDITTSLKEMNL